MKTVTIYSSPTCHFCHMAKAFFTKHNIAFTDRDVATDPSAIQEAVAKSGQMGVPVIDIDGTIVLGFDEPKLRELFEITD